MDTKELIATRGKTHGDYGDHARCTQAIKAIMQQFIIIRPASDTPENAYDLLNDTQRESLDMIAHKIGRILAGDPDFRDHWDDIAGYAKLVAERCTK